MDYKLCFQGKLSYMSRVYIMMVNCAYYNLYSRSAVLTLMCLNGNVN